MISSCFHPAAYPMFLTRRYVSNYLLSFLSFFGIPTLIIALQASLRCFPSKMPIPELPEPAHADLDSMLSRKFGKEVANYFSGSGLFQ